MLHWQYLDTILTINLIIMTHVISVILLAPDQVFSLLLCYTDKNCLFQFKQKSDLFHQMVTGICPNV